MARMKEDFSELREIATEMDVLSQNSQS